MEEKQNRTLHRLQLTDRQKGCIQGVKDVNSFDEKEISLVTEAGTLSIKGEGLHVTSLDLEKQEVDLSDLTREIVSHLSPQSPQKTIRM